MGVTGTKGKGTTATLIYEILKSSEKKVFLAGNIGTPFLQLLPKLDESSWVVLELSSFQLIDCNFSPQIAVVLNITEDHLDWHKNKKEYIDAKKNILKHQDKKDFSVLSSDYEIVKNFQKLTKGKVYFVSSADNTNGCFVKDNKIILNTDDGKKVIGTTDKLTLRGKHNWENVTSAISASYLAGADISSIKKAVFSFKGLEHRLEYVNTVGKIEFYNDSFATGPQPAIAAIKSFQKPITLILGGYDKGLSYKDLIKTISKNKYIDKIILVGDLQEKLRKLLKGKIKTEKIIKLNKSNMDQIVKKAYRITPPGGIVLLSPAAASFDMFESYKERGKLFKDAVNKL